MPALPVAYCHPRSLDPCSSSSKNLEKLQRSLSNFHKQLRPRIFEYRAHVHTQLQRSVFPFDAHDAHRSNATLERLPVSSGRLVHGYAYRSCHFQTLTRWVRDIAPCGHRPIAPPPLHFHRTVRLVLRIEEAFSFFLYLPLPLPLRLSSFAASDYSNFFKTAPEKFARAERAQTHREITAIYARFSLDNFIPNF